MFFDKSGLVSVMDVCNIGVINYSLDSNRISITNFRYIPGKGIKEYGEEELKGKEHFTVFTDRDGMEIRREDYDEKGKLKKLTVTEYNPQGQLDSQSFYSVKLKFYRKRNKEGILEEMTPEGKLIRILREN